MKDKISQFTKLMTLLIATYFLNSCTEYESNMLATDSKGQGSRDNCEPFECDISESEGSEGLVEISESEKHKHNTSNELLPCPFCKWGALYLYEFSDAKQSIVLICEECHVIWNNWNQGQGPCERISKKELLNKYNVKNYMDLFKNKEEGWVTQEEYKKGSTKWVKLLKWSKLLENYRVIID